MAIGALLALAACARSGSARTSESTIVVASSTPVAAVATTVAAPAIARSQSGPSGAPSRTTPAPSSAAPTAVAKRKAVATSMTPLAATTPQAAAPTVAPSANVRVATQILKIDTAPSVVHAGDSVVWDVRTTPDIVAVTAHVSAYTIPLHRIATGHFALNFAIPSNVPAIFHGTYNLDVTGQTTAGATAKRTVSMTFQ